MTPFSGYVRIKPCYSESGWAALPGSKTPTPTSFLGFKPPLKQRLGSYNHHCLLRIVLIQAGFLLSMGARNPRVLVSLTWPVTSQKTVHTFWATTKGRATKEKRDKSCLTEAFQGLKELCLPQGVPEGGQHRQRVQHILGSAGDPSQAVPARCSGQPGLLGMPRFLGNHAHLG